MTCSTRVGSPVRAALEKVLSSLDGSVLTRDECLLLANCSGDDLFGLVVAANELRRQLVGEVVSYVVTRNINFTNVCFVGCKFCAFGVGPRHETAYFPVARRSRRRSVAKPSSGARPKSASRAVCRATCRRFTTATFCAR